MDTMFIHDTPRYGYRCQHGGNCCAPSQTVDRSRNVPVQTSATATAVRIIHHTRYQVPGTHQYTSNMLPCGSAIFVVRVGLERKVSRCHQCFRLFPTRYAVRFRASVLYFSISKTNDPVYAVQICKIRPDFFRFENPMTQVVGFWPKIRRTGSSDFQIEKWHL